MLTRSQAGDSLAQVTLPTHSTKYRCIVLRIAMLVTMLVGSSGCSSNWIIAISNSSEHEATVSYIADYEGTIEQLTLAAGESIVVEGVPGGEFEQVVVVRLSGFEPAELNFQTIQSPRGRARRCGAIIEVTVSGEEIQLQFEQNCTGCL